MAELAHSLPVALACLLQALCAVIVIFFLTQVRGLTPTWPVPWHHARSAEKLMRAGLCSAWLVLLFGAVFSGVSILFALLGEISPAELRAQNGLGIFLSRLAGAVVLAHFAWLSWRAYLRGRLN